VKQRDGKPTFTKGPNIRSSEEKKPDFCWGKNKETPREPRGGAKSRLAREGDETTKPKHKKTSGPGGNKEEKNKKRERRC